MALAVGGLGVGPNYDVALAVHEGRLRVRLDVAVMDHLRPEAAFDHGIRLGKALVDIASAIHEMLRNVAGSGGLLARNLCAQVFV